MSFQNTPKKWRIIVVGLTFVALAGCSPDKSPDGNGSAGAIAAASSISQPSTTAEQWRTAVKGVFDKVNAKKLNDKKSPVYTLDEGTVNADGVTEYFGCFDKSPPKCVERILGHRDGFRKMEFIYDAHWRAHEFLSRYEAGVGKPTATAYISLTDCRRPTLLIQPTFRGGNWMFLERFSLMIDGTVVLDRKIDTGDATRENTHNSVTETAHFAIDEKEIEALRKVDASKQVLIRLTGTKGYVGLDAESTQVFTKGISQMLRNFDALDQSINKLGPIQDPTCPINLPRHTGNL